jgi:flavin reductase (DIM6/NTAB) family NADH-FMN oxidoreductase RutF
MVIDPQEFRHILRHFATSVTVVTSRLGEQLVGFTANAFCSVSLDPPLVLICVANTATSLSAIEESRTFAVNILADNQEKLARNFAMNGPGKYQYFSKVSHHPVKTGAPIFDESLAWLDCRIFAIYPGGDHVIIVGEVVALGARSGEPLLFVDGTYTALPSNS